MIRRLIGRMFLWAMKDYVDNTHGRLLDVERHFVTKRDEKGNAVETLADVPLEQRKVRVFSPRGKSWHQIQTYLEATEGGRRVNDGSR
jgi:hypothetical protein